LTVNETLNMMFVGSWRQNITISSRQVQKDSTIWWRSMHSRPYSSLFITINTMPLVRKSKVCLMFDDYT